MPPSPATSTPPAIPAAASVSGGQIKIDASDVNTDITITANAHSAEVGLTVDAVTNRNIDYQQPARSHHRGRRHGQQLDAHRRGESSDNQVITFGNGGGAPDLAGWRHDRATR